MYCQIIFFFSTMDTKIVNLKCDTRISVTCKIQNKKEINIQNSEKTFTILTISDETGTIDLVAFDDASVKFSSCMEGQTCTISPLLVYRYSGKLRLKASIASNITDSNIKITPFEANLQHFVSLPPEERSDITGLVLYCDEKASLSQNGIKKRKLLITDESGLTVDTINFSDQADNYVEPGTTVKIKMAKKKNDNTAMNWNKIETYEITNDRWEGISKAFLSKFPTIPTILSYEKDKRDIYLLGIPVWIGETDITTSGSIKKECVIVDGTHVIRLLIFNDACATEIEIGKQIAIINCRNSENNKIIVFGGIMNNIPPNVQNYPERNMTFNDFSEYALKNAKIVEIDDLVSSSSGKLEFISPDHELLRFFGNITKCTDSNRLGFIFENVFMSFIMLISNRINTDMSLYEEIRSLQETQDVSFVGARMGLDMYIFAFF